MNRVNYKVSNDLGQRYFPSAPKGTLGIVLVALCRYDLCTVKAPMSGHRRSPIFCPFNRDVRSKEIHLVQRKKKYVGRNVK
jgi:hypothetical protein